MLPLDELIHDNSVSFPTSKMSKVGHDGTPISKVLMRIDANRKAVISHVGTCHWEICFLQEMGNMMTMKWGIWWSYVFVWSQNSCFHGKMMTRSTINLLGTVYPRFRYRPITQCTTKNYDSNSPCLSALYIHQFGSSSKFLSGVMTQFGRFRQLIWICRARGFNGCLLRYAPISGHL